MTEIPTPAEPTPPREQLHVHAAAARLEAMQHSLGRCCREADRNRGIGARERRTKASVLYDVLKDLEEVLRVLRKNFESTGLYPAELRSLMVENIIETRTQVHDTASHDTGRPERTLNPWREIERALVQFQWRDRDSHQTIKDALLPFYEYLLLIWPKGHSFERRFLGHPVDFSNPHENGTYRRELEEVSRITLHLLPVTDRPRGAPNHAEKIEGKPPAFHKTTPARTPPPRNLQKRE